MPEEQLQEKVFSIISQVIAVPVESLSVDSSPDSVTGWSSLKSMNIVVALEQEFDLQFTDEQISEMMNMELILNIVAEALKAKT